MNIYIYVVIIFFLPLLSNSVCSPRHPTPSCFAGFSDSPRFRSFFFRLNFFPSLNTGPARWPRAFHLQCAPPPFAPTPQSPLCRPCALHHACALSALRPHHAAQLDPSPASYACAESPALSRPRRSHAPVKWRTTRGPCTTI
jgi:hypothetical protein